MGKKITKNLFILLIMVVLCFAVSVTASAETWGDYEYRVLDNGTVEITGYNGSDSEIEIPSNICNMVITSIGSEAFASCSNILSVSIGEGITNLDTTAFYSCIGLQKIVVDENNSCFSSFDGVLFNKDKTQLLQYPVGRRINTYIVPKSVIEICDYAFVEALFLEEIIFPESLRKIGKGAFTGCVLLEELTLPVNLEKIEVGAFGITHFLDKIYVLNNDTEIGSMAFATIDFSMKNVSREDFRCLLYECSSFEEIKNLFSHFSDIGNLYHFSTIYCHSGSTAEAYAIENDIDYVLTHFYEGEWIYDYDNMIRFRKCIHCEEIETEQLETTSDGDVEIIEPTDPDTDFIVDVITDYVIIEEALKNNVEGDFEVVKAFDITMTNKDGVHVQPDGTVKVKLPLDWSKDGVYKVYRVNDDGTLTDMNAYRQGSHMVFDTDHFSIYVIVDESEKADEPVIPDEPQEETKDDFFLKLLDFINALIDLLISIFK